MSIGLLCWYFYSKNATQKQKIQQQKITALKKEQEVVAIKSLMKGEEDERVRLAKDLHDGLGGLLSGVKLQIANTYQADEQSHKITENLDAAISEMRRISHNLMPEILEREGLIPALNQFCQSIRQTKALNVAFEYSGISDRYNRTTEISVYRILQELINNILKHARATEAIVQLIQAEDVLHITVEDNGVGMNSSEAGFGMDSITERINFLNGTMSIESEIEMGTTVCIEIALKK